MMDSNYVSREELFALVWERPATDVARSLGISDVALGKLCQRLQVPKPPRGYWARISAGQTPPKPPLVAFRDETEKELHARRRRDAERPGAARIRLSGLQMEFVKRALKELTLPVERAGEIQFAYNGIISATPALLVDLLLLMQGRFKHWYKGANNGKGPSRGAEQSMAKLVGKLLPHVQEQMAAFQRYPSATYSRDDGPILLLRLSGEVQQRLASMARIVREHELALVSADLGRTDHAWVVNYLESPYSDGKVKAKLCVSRTCVWFDCRRERYGYLMGEEERFETNRLKLAELIAVELLPEPTHEKKVPSVINYKSGQETERRLKALRRAEQVLSMMNDAVEHVVDAVPSDEVALFERVWVGSDGPGPITKAREAWRNLEDELEKWRARIESEQVSICRQLLGVSPGDIVTVEQQGRTVRIKVTHAYVDVDDDRASFLLYGTRYRKDGVLGKRSDSVRIPIYSEDPRAKHRAASTPTYSQAYHFRGQSRRW